MIVGKKFPFPPRATLEDASSDARVLWRDGEALAIMDVTTGAPVARLDVPGLVWARLRQYPGDGRIPREHGSALEIHTSTGTLLGRPDLSGALRPWPFPKQAPDARIGDVAIYTVFEMFERGVILHVETGERLARAPEGVLYQAADPESGLFFGIARADGSGDTGVVAVRATDGGVAWKTTVFAVKVDDPQVRVDGGAVVASATRRGQDLVVRLDPRTGAVLPERPSDHEERMAPGGEPERIRIEAGQAVVTRAGGEARVALPPLSGARIVGRYVVGILASPSARELAVVPLPESGEHALELQPAGEAPPESGPFAIVKMVGTSMPVVIVEHPTYGRVNLMRAADTPVAKGDRIVLEGVVVKPGGVVDVARWRVAGATAARGVTRVELPARAAPEEAPTERPADGPPLAERARERGVDLPAAVVRFFDAVDRDESLREALASLGFHVEAWALHEDVLATYAEEAPDLVPEGFFPLWGDDYHVGGLLPDGSFAVVDLEDTEVLRFASLGAAARDLWADESRGATVELALEAVERAGACEG